MYVDNEGNIQEVAGATYANGKVTFYIDHFSCFVVYQYEEPIVSGNGEGNNSLLFVGIVSAILVGMLAFIAVFNRKG